MSTLGTHVLDTALGKPAAGMRVTLSRGNVEVGSGITDADGRVKDLHGSSPLAAGSYRLSFQAGDYFRAGGRESFYDVIVVDFIVVASVAHYHVPLLLGPFGYTTYRGS